jgi:catechol 2,3-dioxygenase-like lactoylglutathione lyase family enzyme
MEDDMLKQLTHVQVWVLDQDEALKFYTEKLGMEVREDVTVPEMGNFRWLSVGVPGQDDVSITLMSDPGPAGVRRGDAAEDPGAARNRRSRRAVLLHGDAQTTYEELKSAAWSSRRSRRSNRTASTPASATRPATTSGWRSRASCAA